MPVRVAALAAEAYMRSHGVRPSPSKLKAILLKSADDLVGPERDDLWEWNNKTEQFELQSGVVSDKPGQDDRYGSGRVNAVRAIAEAMK